MATLGAGLRRRRAGARGFTLIELIYAAAIFEIGVVGLASFQVVAARGVGRARDLTIATQLATSAIEASRALPGAALLEQPQPILSYASRDGAPATGAGYFVVSTLATQPPGVVAYYDLVVSVDWLNPATGTMPHAVRMETFVATE